MAVTTNVDARKAYKTAVKNIEGLERALHAARRLRANAIRAMRDSGMTWVQIERETGLTRQRLSRLLHDFQA